MISRNGIGKSVIRVLKRRNILAAGLLSAILASSILSVIVNNFALGDTIPSDGPYIRITVDSENRSRYGFVYPLTYVFSVPDGASGLKVWLRYDVSEAWAQLPENTSGDLFNGIYAVRFNYTENKAYVSAGFNGTGNSIHLRFTDSSNNGIYDVSYLGVSQYYDNRKCAVTVTMDDWDAERSSYILRAINLFQERKMWVTPGIVTNGISYLGESFNATTWTEIQNEVNEGYVEPVSHSRTHPHPPYSNISSEVQGSRDDIIGNLTYIPYSGGSNKYVYVWMEPFGEWDNAIRTQVGQSIYIVDREYYYTSDVSWGDYNSSLGIYTASHYPDPGGRWDDTAAINSVFDQAYNNGYIYHGEFHPAGNETTRLTEAQWQNITAHLDYIGGRKDVWYVGFGHLYMYHYLQEFSSQLLTVETVGFITDTTDSDFQQGTFENTETTDGSLTLIEFPSVPGTFGNTAWGTTTGNYWPDQKFGSKFTLSEAASVTKITVALRDYVETGKANAVKAAIYDASLNLKGQTGLANLPANFQWVAMNFSSPVSLSAGDYWLDVCVDERAEFKYSAGGTNQFHYKSVTFSSEFTNPFGTPNGYQNWQLSIYADFLHMGIGDGSYVSKWHDAGKIVDWTTISWSETAPAGADIVISTRTAPELFMGIPDESKASPWSGNVTNPAGSLITSPANRFIQYKVYLSTSISDTPSLHSVTVFYENITQDTYNLTVNTVGSGSVSLNSSGPYYYGDGVRLTAVPAVGWSFSGWSGDLSGSVNPADLEITGNITVTATFIHNAYSLTFSAGASQSLVAGQLSSKVTIQRSDIEGNPVTSGSTTIVLGSTSSNAIFYSDAGITKITSITITGGQSQASFWYNDTVAGSPTLTASSSGLVSATTTFTIKAGAAAKLVFVAGASQTLRVNQLSSVINIQRQDKYGNPMTSGSKTVALRSAPSKNSFFYSDPGFTRVSAVTIRPGSSTVSFWFKATSQGSRTLTASASGLTSASTQFKIIR